MKWSDGYRMRLVLVGLVAAMLLSGSNAKADFTFGEVTNLGPMVNTGGSEAGGSLSADGLTLYFQSAGRPGAIGYWNLYMVRRETLDDDWGEALNLDCAEKPLTFRPPLRGDIELIKNNYCLPNHE